MGFMKRSSVDVDIDKLSLSFVGYIGVPEMHA